MKIKFSKDYSWLKATYDSDRKRFRDGEELTFFSDYSGHWETADVTLEELQEYVKAGYAIKINF